MVSRVIDVSPINKVKWFYSFILFSTGASILARPDTSLNSHIELVTSIQIELIALIFWLMIPTLYATCSITKNIFAVIPPMTPLVAYTFLLAQQMNSFNSSLVHLAMALSVLVSIILTYYLVVELDEKSKLINILKSGQNDGG